jgi:hypothetical protein
MPRRRGRPAAAAVCCRIGWLRCAARRRWVGRNQRTCRGDCGGRGRGTAGLRWVRGAVSGAGSPVWWVGRCPTAGVLVVGDVLVPGRGGWAGGAPAGTVASRRVAGCHRRPRPDSPGGGVRRLSPQPGANMSTLRAAIRWESPRRCQRSFAISPSAGFATADSRGTGRTSGVHSLQCGVKYAQTYKDPLIRVRRAPPPRPSSARWRPAVAATLDYQPAVGPTRGSR